VTSVEVQLLPVSVVARSRLVTVASTAP
jgi:hypothetical protein